MPATTACLKQMAGLVLQKLKYFSCNETAPAMEGSSCLIADTKATKLLEGCADDSVCSNADYCRRMPPLALCDSDISLALRGKVCESLPLVSLKLKADGIWKPLGCIELKASILNLIISN